MALMLMLLNQLSLLSIIIGWLIMSRGSGKRLIYGIGVNDADYCVQPTVSGKQVICPYYKRWFSMLFRCYSDACHKSQPTYKDCFVCDEWLTFSVFKSWMQSKEWEGNELDKDILVVGNKCYSPSRCIFVSSKVNSLLRQGERTKNTSLMSGVDIHKATGLFRAQYKDADGRKFHIGLYGKELDAHNAYKVKKYEAIAVVSKDQCKKVKSALMSYVIPMYNN